MPRSPASTEPTDALAGVAWRCASTAPGACPGPETLAATGALDWIDCAVPGTAAGALRAAGSWRWGEEDADVLDGRDWWFSARFGRPPGDGPWDLRFGGLATLADVWLNGEPLLHSENMFVSHVVGVDGLREDNELVIRCASFAARLSERHPRPRFKSRLVRHQAQRWYRTTILGRVPGWSRWAAPVGPVGPVTLWPRPARGRIEELELITACRQSGGGELSFAAVLRGGLTPVGEATLRVGEVRVPVRVSGDPGELSLAAELVLPDAERWWPHSHGEQPLYPVVLELDGEARPLRSVGFRTLELDRDGGAFTFRVNGRELFLRGVTWAPIDAVTLTASPSELAAELARVKAAGLTLIRLGGFGAYESELFWDLCDELGIMVWQDCMIAAVDPPEDPDYLASLERELVERFGGLGGRPSLAMTCGSSETYQQGALFGLPFERYRSEVLESFIPGVLARRLPGVPYAPSSPSGGEPPIRVDTGIGHYFGVGPYLRDPLDARLAGVRFAAECLSFSNLPERGTIDAEYGSASVVGHDARWKSAVAYDAGAAWDFEDVRDHYVARLFGVDALAVRYADPEYALDLGRAAVAELIERVMADWRAPDSGCAGAVVLAWRDLWPGAGWGMIDATGRAKASYHALARACAPCAVHLRDEGLNGLVVDIHNDRPVELEATLELTTYAPSGQLSERVEHPLSLAAGGASCLDAAALLGGFRDLTAAYRFSPGLPDAVLARLLDPGGGVLARTVFLPGGPARPRLADVGLTAALDGGVLRLHSERLATFVAVELDEVAAGGSWLHLAPGETVELGVAGAATSSRGTVRALNALSQVDIEEEGP